ncbi:hypothetical protein DPMN_169018 [Dreissena polymorpha]|uniref:Uncharacterized protein n=1 Tax=Dreissena polymorpha TaxID=45954 RepID=A0A9D4F694_DREPO|nr:hypothetical protein DPMN_169018 [Dreissena polymorpha]
MWFQKTRVPERPKVAHLRFKGTDLSCAATDVNFHEETNFPLPGSHVFQQTGTIFKHIKDFSLQQMQNARPPELILDIIGKNLQTNFLDDRTINLASRVLTRQNAPPPGAHVSTNLNHFLTRPRVFTRQMLTPHDARWTTDKGGHNSSP